MSTDNISLQQVMYAWVFVCVFVCIIYVFMYLRFHEEDMWVRVLRVTGIRGSGTVRVGICRVWLGTIGESRVLIFSFYSDVKFRGYIIRYFKKFPLVWLF